MATAADVLLRNRDAETATHVVRLLDIILALAGLAEIPGRDAVLHNTMLLAADLTDLYRHWPQVEEAELAFYQTWYERHVVWPSSEGP